MNFVLRYFPLRSHFNAERAARAVEAAAQQGQLEAMYRKMYETQAQWGEKQIPADDVFRGFAQQLGLDMEAFDATYNDPATLERIQLDIADGTALGVQGTPTFYQRRTDPAPQLRRPDHRTRPGLGTWIGPLSRFLAGRANIEPGSQAVNESISSPAPQRPGQLCDRRQPHQARIGLVQPARQLGHRQRIVKSVCVIEEDG